jgi:hypothetical protein
MRSGGSGAHQSFQFGASAAHFWRLALACALNALSMNRPRFAMTAMGCSGSWFVCSSGTEPAARHGARRIESVLSIPIKNTVFLSPRQGVRHIVLRGTGVFSGSLFQRCHEY